MRTVSGGALIDLVGLLSQATLAVLLVILFLFLRRLAARHRYFFYWGNAWIALCIALLALAAVLLEQLLPLDLIDLFTWSTTLLCVVYQLGKLEFLALLLVGTMTYVRGAPSAKASWSAYTLMALYAIVSGTFNPSLSAIIFWQMLVVIPVMAYCGVVILTLPVSRRNLGNRTTGLSFIATALLWSVYLMSFKTSLISTNGVARVLLQLVAGHNSYFDLLLQVLLAFGMILILLESSRREVDNAHKELEIAHARLLRESFLDALTRTLNRRAFNEGFGLEEARANFGAVVLLDLDHFKDVNDTFGHESGDRLLQHFATVLRARLRTSDKLYRWGGDEFLLVMPRVRAADVAPRLKMLLQSAPPLKLSHCEASVPVRASIGAADYRSASDITKAMQCADRSMYAHKRRRDMRLADDMDTKPSGRSAEV